MATLHNSRIYLFPYIYFFNSIPFYHFVEEEHQPQTASTAASTATTAVKEEDEVEDIEGTLEAPFGESEAAAVPQHRWSNNRRSQLLKQQSLHQGEFNRVVFSDSRRRPLSCTPPNSTSLSTSVSIDEDDVTASPHINSVTSNSKELVFSTTNNGVRASIGKINVSMKIEWKKVRKEMVVPL